MARKGLILEVEAGVPSDWMQTEGAGGRRADALPDLFVCSYFLFALSVDSI